MPPKITTPAPLREVLQRSQEKLQRLKEAVDPAALQRAREKLREAAPDPERVRDVFRQLQGRIEPKLEQPKKRKHKPHKPHRQYQRERARTILSRTPNWGELSDNDLVDLVQMALPKKDGLGPPDRKTILRAAKRLRD
jgi:hypothetical protein